MADNYGIPADPIVGYFVPRLCLGEHERRERRRDRGDAEGLGVSEEWDGKGRNVEVGIRTSDSNSEAAIGAQNQGWLSMMFRLKLAMFGVSLALTFAWACAVLSWAQRHVPASRLEPPSLKAPAPSREIQASSLERPYVATDIGKAYHLADSKCFYIQKQSKHTLIRLSKSEAEARGLPPCTNCLLHRITSTSPSTQSPEQPTFHQ